VGNKYFLTLLSIIKLSRNTYFPLNSSFDEPHFQLHEPFSVTQRELPAALSFTEGPGGRAPGRPPPPCKLVLHIEVPCGPITVSQQCFQLLSFFYLGSLVRDNEKT